MFFSKFGRHFSLSSCWDLWQSSELDQIHACLESWLTSELCNHGHSTATAQVCVRKQRHRRFLFQGLSRWSLSTFCLITFSFDRELEFLQYFSTSEVSTIYESGLIFFLLRNKMKTVIFSQRGYPEVFRCSELYHKPEFFLLMYLLGACFWGFFLVFIC